MVLLIMSHMLHRKPHTKKSFFIFAVIALVVVIFTGIVISISLNSFLKKEAPVVVTTKSTPEIMVSSDGVNFFAGEVLEKQNTYLILKGEKDNIKLEVRGNISFWEIPKVLNTSLKELGKQPPKSVNYTSVKKGDDLNVTIEFDKGTPIAKGGFIFR